MIYFNFFGIPLFSNFLCWLLLIYGFSADNNSNFDWAVDEIDLEAIEKYGFSIERKSKDNIVNCYEKKTY